MRGVLYAGFGLCVLACHRPAPTPSVSGASGATSQRPAASNGSTPLAPINPASPTLPRTPDLALNPERAEAFLRKLCVTEGDLSEHLSVTAPKMRCVQVESAGDQAKLRFRYDGVSAERTALKSGAVREQLGIKLRARDTCNLLYVMWRFTPKAELVVSFKDNPGESTHDECENRGYTNLVPTTKAPPPAVVPGGQYELSARIEGGRLRAWIDNQLVWEGLLPEGVRNLAGPAGVRSDNVAWSMLDFDVGAGAPMHAPASLPNCRNRR